MMGLVRCGLSLLVTKRMEALLRIRRQEEMDFRDSLRPLRVSPPTESPHPHGIHAAPPPFFVHAGLRDSGSCYMQPNTTLRDVDTCLSTPMSRLLEDSTSPTS